MARAYYEDVISMTAQYSGYAQEVVKDVLDAYANVVWKLLVNGIVSRIPPLGEWSLKDYNAQPPREFKRPDTGEVMMLDEQPAHQRPKFKFSKKLRQEIKEHSVGALR